MKRRFKFEQHMTCGELKKILPEDIYNNYSKITIIRNPYDQAISDYYDMKNRPEHEEVKDFDHYLEIRCENFFKKNYEKFVYNNSIETDIIFRYENLKEDLKKFCLNKKNGYSRYRVIIDGREVSMIENLEHNELTIKREIKNVDIVPALEGSSLGIFSFLIGAFTLPFAGSSMAAMLSIMLIAQGIADMLSKPPEMPEQRQIQNPSSDPTELANSYLFNGPVNVLNEGGPVPIGYGRLMVGSQVIMSAYDVKYLLTKVFITGRYSLMILVLIPVSFNISPAASL